MAKGSRSPDFSFSLKENGTQSLWRGIESFQEYRRRNNRWLLKEAVMFVHQGIELLMKQILVQHSEYLIFDDIGQDTVRKWKQARSQGMLIFDLEKPPRTATYTDAISRVEAFVHPAGLDEWLVSQLGKLNRLRNQVEHYAIAVEADEVERLLGAIHQPILDLFEAEIGGIKSRQPAETARTWNMIEVRAREGEQRERDVAELVRRFRGQEVPGHLFNLDSPVILPTFTEFVLGDERQLMRKGMPMEIDILAENDSESWMIQVKTSRNKLPARVVQKMAALGSAHSKATLWLVFFGEPSPAARRQAEARRVLLTGDTEWQQLRQLVYAAGETNELDCLVRE